MSKTQDSQVLNKPAVAADMALDSIKVTMNIRKHFDPAHLKELSENIKKVGVLQPILVRAQNGHHELLAGERRYRAAKMAGLTHIPVRSLIVNDQEAAEIQAFENLHRQDLTAIEEARAFKMLLDAGGHTVESLAERVDKSVRHVYRAIALLDLPEKIVELIESGKLTPAHGHQLLRVPEDSRLNVFDEWRDGWEYKENPTAKGLAEHIDSEMGTDLNRATFPKDKPYAGMTACKVCPFNSGNQGQLFDGAEKGRCLKSDCFETKTAQAQQDCVVAAQTGAYKDLAFLGLAERDYNGIRFKGGMIISPALAKDPKAKKLIALKPEKFGLAVAPADGYGDSKKPEAVLVCHDPALFRQEVPKALEPKKSSNPYGSSRETPRQRFVRERQIEALCRAVKPKLNDRAFWAPIIESCRNAYSTHVPQRVFGLNGSSVTKVKTEDMPALAFLMAIAEHTELGAKELKAMGVDVAPIKKAAAAAAEKEWNDRKKAKLSSKK